MCSIQFVGGSKLSQKPVTLVQLQRPVNTDGNVGALITVCYSQTVFVCMLMSLIKCLYYLGIPKSSQKLVAANQKLTKTDGGSVKSAGKLRAV